MTDCLHCFFKAVAHTCRDPQKLPLVCFPHRICFMSRLAAASKFRFLAIAQLVRLPNVFTAMADICLAGLATGAIFLNLSAFIAVLLAWGTIAGHAIRIARSNPILALRYE